MVDEFQDTNRLQCEHRRPARSRPGRARRLLRRRRVPVDLRLPPRRRRGVPRAARARGAAPAADAATTARGPRCSRRSTISSARSSATGYQPLAASGEFPDPVFGHPVELLVTDKRSYRDAGAHWRDGEAQAIARRVRELVDTRRRRARARSCCCSRPAPTPSATRRRCAPRACRPTARPGAGTSASSRSSTCSRYLRLLHNRYDDEALVDRARVAVRRRLERRARADPPPRRASARSTPGIERSLPDALSDDDERLLRAFKQRYERLVAASARLSRSSGCARRSSRRTTTTSRCSRAGTASAATRTCAS